MKNCYILEILICSQKEQIARREIFQRNLTIILAENNAGKSVLLKSIYYAFGANPAFDRRWRDLYVTVVVKFEIDNKHYKMVRWGSSCGLFDAQDHLVTYFRATDKNLNEAMSNLFSFHMVWNDKEGKTVIPPPAFMLLPYYIDQDVSWKYNWKAFDNLAVLSNWRTAIIEYHTGLKPNEYYKTKTEHAIKTKEHNEHIREHKLLKVMIEDINQTLTKVDLNLDVEQFKTEISQLIEESTKLQIKENSYKLLLNNLYSQRITIDNQLKITNSVLKEIKNDLQFATNQLNDTIECPTCGAIYDNNFEERFAIAKDESKCYELINLLSEEREKITAKINIEKNKLTKHNQETNRIQKILSKKQEQITLKDIIESQGKIQLKSVFSQKINLLEEKDKNLVYDLVKISQTLKGFTDKERRNQILTLYQDTMKRYLRQLDIRAQESEYKRIDTQLDGLGLGSDTSRSHLAYYFSILKVIKEYGTATFFPIIIDEPNQQGQDKENMPKILQFITTNQPEDSQIILGIESTRDIQFQGKIIKLHEKYALLNKDAYFDINNEIMPLIDKLSAQKDDKDSQLSLF